MQKCNMIIFYYDDQTSEDQQEIEQTPLHAAKDTMEDDDTPVESQIVG